MDQAVSTALVSEESSAIPSSEQEDIIFWQLGLKAKVSSFSRPLSLRGLRRVRKLSSLRRKPHGRASLTPADMATCRRGYRPI
jgi:hypothetical protein